MPNGTAHPATIMEEEGGGSSENGEDPDGIPVEVHDNPRFTKGVGKGKGKGTGKAKAPTAPSSSIPSRHLSFSSVRKNSDANVPATYSMRSESPSKRRGVLSSLAALFHVGGARGFDLHGPGHGG